jgi:hypothetical protein
MSVKTFTAFELASEVTDLNGEKIPAGKNQNLTVKEAFRSALGTLFADEVPSQGNPVGLDFDKKMARYKIAEKLMAANEAAKVELTVEELAELKKCVGRAYYGEVLGFLTRHIESPSSEN